MKFTLSLRLYGKVLAHITKPSVYGNVRREVLREYKRILTNARDVGPRNPLLSACALAAFFIAMNRRTNVTPQGNYTVLEKGIRNSRLFRASLSDASHYFSEKKMAARRAWAERTHLEKYPGDWVVDVVEEGEDFRFGLDYTRCGVCSLCRDEGCPEMAAYLCRLDYLLVEIMGVGLRRTGTLAEGAQKCDFRFYQKEKPQ